MGTKDEGVEHEFRSEVVYCSFLFSKENRCEKTSSLTAETTQIH